MTLLTDTQLCTKQVTRPEAGTSVRTSRVYASHFPGPISGCLQVGNPDAPTRLASLAWLGAAALDRELVRCARTESTAIRRTPTTAGRDEDSHRGEFR